MTTLTHPTSVKFAVVRWTATLVSSAAVFLALAWAVAGATQGLVV